MVHHRIASLCCMAAYVVACDPTPRDEGLTQVQRSLAAIVANCTATVGVVQVRRADADHWVDVKVPAILRSGDWLRTGPAGLATVSFLGSGVLQIEEDALVVIDAAAEGSARISVAAGVVRGSIQASTEAEPQNLVIANKDGSELDLRAADPETPVEFRLTNRGDGTELAVSSGEAAVRTGGTKVVLRAGQAADFVTGRLGHVVQLLDFPLSLEPTVDARLRWKPNLNIDLKWRPVEKARNYRVQVAADLSFRRILASATVANPQHRYSPSQDGMHAWRVAACDAQGHYGEYGFARRVFLEKETPVEHLLTPPDGYEVGYTMAPPKIRFSWKPSRAAQYRLVVGSSADLLNHTVVEQLSGKTAVEIDDLEAGSYFWGVFSGSRELEPLFLRPRRLHIKKARTNRIKTTLDQWGE